MRIDSSFSATTALLWLATVSNMSNAFEPAAHSIRSITTSSHKAAVFDDESAASTTISTPTTDTSTRLSNSNSKYMEQEREQQKKLLLEILRPSPRLDPVLADPITKEPLILSPKTGPYFGSDRAGGGTTRKTFYEMQAANGKGSGVYTGSSGTYYDLLTPKNSNDLSAVGEESRMSRLWRNLTPWIPPLLRPALATSGIMVSENYVPMRDLFTSPVVSYSYERGWRQNFRAAGFPGADKESKMAMEYFAPSIAAALEQSGDPTSSVLVDMSCATGLFTRRFAQSGKYGRVLGCDYSDAMLTEARRRIQGSRELRMLSKTRLDLVRLDVGQIAMQNNSVDALHAGAAMHCWPDLPAAVSEIYRVLKPGGRYFATTFLNTWFGTLQAAEGGATGPSRQAYHYFKSAKELKSLLVDQGGFDPKKVSVEILQPSCVVIRCEK